MDRITVFDTTLRDGELSEGVRFDIDDKIAIASLLAAMGVDVIEVAVAGRSRASIELVQALAACVTPGTICVLAPWSPAAIDAAGEALHGAASGRIHIYQTGSAGKGAAERTETMVRRARSLVDDVEMSPANGACADLDAVAAVTRAALRGGATTINLADTFGRALPEDVALRIREVHARVPELLAASVSFHGHDDLGLATANTLAAVRAGARQVEVAVNGLGARAGNAALEEVVAAIAEHTEALGVSTGVDTSRLLELSREVEARSGMAVGPQKAVVGRGARWSGPRRRDLARAFDR